MRAGHIIRISVFGQIKRHQRGEIRALGHRGHNPRLIGRGISRSDHGGHQIGHDDSAREMARGFGQHSGQHCAIAQMQVPVIGAAKGDLICHGEGGLHNPTVPDHV